MSSKRIEQLIDDMYEYIESCKPKGFSTTQVIVPKDEMYDMLDELRLKVPDEITRCRKMIANRDAIIANAEEKAAKIIEDAKKQAEALVQESEIMRQAYLQANELVSRATQDANDTMMAANSEAEQIHMGALAYTNDMLGAIERVLATAYTDAKNRTDALLETLNSNLEIVRNNRRELVEEVAPEGEMEEQPQTAYEEEYVEETGSSDDYEIDSDAFLRNIST